MSNKKTHKMILEREDAIRVIHNYYNKTLEDEHGRFMSWRHCYNVFRENRNKTDDETLDYLALHLAFYLASWGMYRGSSFLLGKDYKVHIPIVRLIMEEKYNDLCGISAEELCKEENLELIKEISNKIRKVFLEEHPTSEGKNNNATDTLVSKILLGTLGCTPAYDRYYIQAVKRYDISTGKYGNESLKRVAEYYIRYKEDFEKVRAEISRCGIEYPPMKLMDMCMWQIEYEREQEEKRKKKLS